MYITQYTSLSYYLLSTFIMNSSSLRNPRPSDGFKDWPTLGSHGSHSEGARLPGPGVGTLAPASHSTNVHQLMANPNASYPFFCGAFQNGWQQAYIEGFPMFINLQNDRGEKTTISGRHQSHNIMASLQVLNYYLTLGSSDPIFIQQHIRKHRLNQSLIPMYPTTSELTERFKEYTLKKGLEDRQRVHQHCLRMYKMRTKLRYSMAKVMLQKP